MGGVPAPVDALLYRFSPGLVRLGPRSLTEGSGGVIDSMPFTRRDHHVLGAAFPFPSDSLTSTTRLPESTLGPLWQLQVALYFSRLLPVIRREGGKAALREMTGQRGHKKRRPRWQPGGGGVEVRRRHRPRREKRRCSYSYYEAHARVKRKVTRPACLERRAKTGAGDIMVEVVVSPRLT